jgi:hypothetical protein
VTEDFRGEDYPTSGPLAEFFPRPEEPELPDRTVHHWLGKHGAIFPDLPRLFIGVHPDPNREFWCLRVTDLVLVFPADSEYRDKLRLEWPTTKD